MNQLSEIFKAGLDKTQYSQAEAARLSGIERKTFNTYVNGTREPDFETLIKIASTLKVENEICSLIMEHFVPVQKEEKMGTNTNGVADGLESKYMALLEKTVSDKDKNIEEKEADLKVLRAAVNKITSTDQRVSKLETTVDAHEGKWSEYEPMLLGLREFVTEELAGLKSLSREKVAVALGKKVAEQKKKVEPTHIQKH